MSIKDPYGKIFVGVIETILLRRRSNTCTFAIDQNVTVNNVDFFNSVDSEQRFNIFILTRSNDCIIVLFNKIENIFLRFFCATTG